MLKTTYNFFHRHYHKRYHNQYEHAKKLFAFDIFLLSVALVMLTSTLYFLFWNPGLTDQIDLKISLGDSRIKSGQEVRLTVDYKNRSKYALNDATIALHLPSGFVVDREKTPTTIFSEQSIFSIQNIKPGAQGQTDLYGHIWVTPKKDESITALLSYLPENSKYKEQKLGTFLMNLPESVLQSTLQLPTTSFANNTVAFSFTVKNSSDQKLNDLNINFNFPGKININEDDLRAIDLEKNTQKTVNGTLVMPAKSGQYNLNATLNGKFNNTQIKILDLQGIIKTFSPQVDIKASLNDQTSYAEPSQEINASIAWQNNGQFQLQNQAVRLTFTPGVVDLKTTARENNFKLDGNSLIIDNSIRTALANGAPGANDQFNFKILLLPTFSLGGLENPALEIKPTFTGELKSVTGQRFEVTGEKTSIPLATELNLNSSVRYYSDDGDQLGRGPLPPVVGQTTKYWVFVQLNNTTNPIKEASLDISLNSNANFTGKQSVTIGPSLNHSKGIVSWKYREVPAHSQTGWYFEVAVTPTPQQLGQNIDLVKTINFSAVDKTTGKTFSLQKSSLNNILLPADLGSQKGNLVK